MELLSGLLLVNKPVGMSSFDCIRRLKRLLPKKTKVGHAGTLDLLASGLLVIAIGKATKLLTAIIGDSKEYRVKARLGELRDSLDLESPIAFQEDVPEAAAQALEKAFYDFPLSYQQIPPVYSALKHEGKPLYHLVRKNKLDSQQLDEIVASKAREVVLIERELISVQLPYFTCKVTVSKGAYIRSLAHDIAQSIGMVATTYELERTKIGDYLLDDALDINSIITLEDIKVHLKTPDPEKLKSETETDLV